jgi:ribose transport system permease protein
MRRFVGRYGTALAGLAICVFLALFARNFATTANLLNVLKQSSFLTLLAIGFTFALITSELDLSFANICSLAAVTTGALLYHGYPFALAIVAGIVIGAAGGMLNGFLVTVVRVPSLIATLGTASIAGGAAFMLTGGVAYVGRWDPRFLFLAKGTVLGVPVLVIVTLAVLALSMLVSEAMRVGVHMRATGEAPESARRAGVAVRGMKFLGLTLSGLAAGVTAVLLVANLSSASPEMAGDFLLEAIAAVLLGMTMFVPGKANVIGSFVGALIITVLGNGLVLLGAAYYLQSITLGLIIIGSVGLSASVMKRAAFSI